MKNRKKPPFSSLFLKNSLDLPFWGAFALFFILALFPLLYLLTLSFTDFRLALDSNTPLQSQKVWDHFWLTSRQVELLQRSLGLALKTTLWAFLLGGSSAWILSKYRFPGQFLFATLLTAPVFIPSHLHGVMWNSLFGRKGYINEWLQTYGWSPWLLIGPNTDGAAWILAISLYPYVFFLTYQALRSLDGNAEKSFLLHFGKRRAFFSFYLPLISPALLVSLLLVFILAAGNFGVPQVLVVQVYSQEIFTQYSAFLNYPAATLVSLPLVILCLLALALILKLEKKVELYSKQAAPALYFPKGFGFYIGLIGLVGLIFFTLLGPFIFLLHTAKWGTFLREAIQNGGEELKTSFWAALIGATLLTGIAFILGAGFAKRNNTGKKKWRFLFWISLSPLAFPGILLATGMVKMWVRFDMIYLSLWMLIFASIARFSPFGIHIMERVFSRLKKSPQQAALLYGGSFFQWKISFQLLSKDLCTIWILSYALTFGEIDAAILVKNPENIPIGATIISLLHFGHPEIIATLTLMAILIGVTPVFLYFLSLEELLELY